MNESNIIARARQSGTTETFSRLMELKLLWLQWRGEFLTKLEGNIPVMCPRKMEADYFFTLVTKTLDEMEMYE